MDLFFDLKGHHPLGAGKPANVLRFPQNLSLAGELKDVALVKIDEQEATPRIHLNVAQGGEHAVAGVVREQQKAFVGDDDEPGLPTAVGYVDPAAPVVVALGELAGYEQGVGPGDHGRLAPVQGVSAADHLPFSDGLDVVAKVVVSGLDVLRAVGKGLPHANFECVLPELADLPIHPESAAGLEIEPEGPDIRAVDQRFVQRVPVNGPGPYFEL